MGCASGTSASTRLRKARVDLAFSLIQWVRAAAALIVPSGSTSSSGDCVSQPWSSGVGTR